METIEALRENKAASWAIALFLGVIFRYPFGIAKHYIATAAQKLDFIQTLPQSQMVAFMIIFNFAVDFASSLIAAVICGSFLVYIFKERAKLFSIVTALVIVGLDSRLRRFWLYPDVGMQISGLIGPLLKGLVFAGTVWSMGTIKARITSGSSGLGR